MGSGIIDCFRSAKLFDQPWPHLQFEGFVPKDYAQEIANNWPIDGFEWLRHSDAMRADGTSSRRYQPLESRFKDIAQELLSKEVESEICSRLGVDCMLYPIALLIEDAPGYWIRKHTDCAGKVISAQCYLADDGAHETQGVVLEGNGIKQIPYLFNSGYAFKVTRKSWHRVLRSPTRRRSLQLIYYDRPNPAI